MLIKGQRIQAPSCAPSFKTRGLISEMAAYGILGVFTAHSCPNIKYFTQEIMA